MRSTSGIKRVKDYVMKWILAVALGVLMAPVGVGVGWLSANGNGQSMIGRTLVLDWGDRLSDDGKVTAKALYGAHAFIAPEADGYAVSVRIYIDQPDTLVSYCTDCGVIGHAQTFREAHEKWGKVTWSQDAVVFGDPIAGFRVPRQDFQRYR
jgi:hypothetical protein